MSSETQLIRSGIKYWHIVAGMASILVLTGVNIQSIRSTQAALEAMQKAGTPLAKSHKQDISNLSARLKVIEDSWSVQAKAWGTIEERTANIVKAVDKMERVQEELRATRMRDRTQ